MGFKWVCLQFPWWPHLGLPIWVSSLFWLGFRWGPTWWVAQDPCRPHIFAYMGTKKDQTWLYMGPNRAIYPRPFYKGSDWALSGTLIGYIMGFKWVLTGFQVGPNLLGYRAMFAQLSTKRDKKALDGTQEGDFYETHVSPTCLCPHVVLKWAQAGF